MRHPRWTHCEAMRGYYGHLLSMRTDTLFLERALKERVMWIWTLGPMDLRMKVWTY